ERNRTVEFFLRSSPVQIGLPLDESQRRSGIRIVWVELYRFLRGPSGDCYVFARPSWEVLVGPRQPVVGGREIGIGINRLLEVLGGLLSLLAVTAQVVIALKICLQNFGGHWPRLR